MSDSDEQKLLNRYFAQLSAAMNDDIADDPERDGRMRIEIAIGKLDASNDPDWQTCRDEVLRMLRELPNYKDFMART